MTYSFICPECKHQFITRDKRQTYCSHTCAGAKHKFPKEHGYKLPSENPCFFNWHIPLEEIERLMMELKQVERATTGI